jgi:hypothetical protein
LRKGGTFRYRRLTEYQTSGPEKNPTHIYHNQKIQYSEQKRILKAAKEKRQVTYKGKPIRVTADFSAQILHARRSWKDIFQTLKENNCQPRLVYTAKLSFLIEGEMKIFHNKQKLKEFMTTKPALKKILKELLYTEEEIRVSKEIA